MGELTALVHPGPQEPLPADPGPRGQTTLPAQPHASKKREEARLAIQMFTQQRLEPAPNRNVEVLHSHYRNDLIPNIWTLTEVTRLYLWYALHIVRT